MPPLAVPGERKRRHHHRSRNGCITCKKRHKRCDEGKPFCRNCMENGGSCGYQSSTAASPQDSPSTSLLVIPTSENLTGFFSATTSDPFQTLPVNLDPESQLLLNHFQVYRMFVRGLVKRNPGDSLFELAISDAALLHASLVLSASHWISLGGMSRIGSSTMYFHKVEAIRIVNERMSDPNGAIQDATMGAVACLTILETSFGSPDTANLHMDGLYKLILLRKSGELSHQPISPLIRKLIQLADLSTAAITRKEPRFQPKCFQMMLGSRKE